MEITDVKSAIIGSNIVIRVVTDKGIDAFLKDWETTGAKI